MEKHRKKCLVLKMIENPVFFYFIFLKHENRAGVGRQPWLRSVRDGPGFCSSQTYEQERKVQKVRK